MRAGVAIFAKPNEGMQQLNCAEMPIFGQKLPNLIAMPIELTVPRVHFENSGYLGPRSGNAPAHGASGPNCQTTVSKLDAV